MMKTRTIDGRTMRRSTTGMAAGLLCVAVAACGNLTAGGIGEAVVVVSGDAQDTPTSAASWMQSAVLDGADGPGPRRSDDDQPEGQLEAEMLLAVVTDDGTIVPLSDDEFEVSVDLEGVEQDETSAVSLPADVYTDLRIVFLQIEVQVDAGLIIDGVEVTGPIDIELETDSLVVLKPLGLGLEDQESVEILVDLNAASWLQAVDPTTSSVDATVFADLITVTVR
jgi:hypothetical protein